MPLRKAAGSHRARIDEPVTRWLHATGVHIETAAEAATEQVVVDPHFVQRQAGHLCGGRMAQQAVQVAPAPYATLITPQHVGGSGVK
jgi:hypothetical protein